MAPEEAGTEAGAKLCGALTSTGGTWMVSGGTGKGLRRRARTFVMARTPERSCLCGPSLQPPRKPLIIFLLNSLELLSLKASPSLLDVPVAP